METKTEINEILLEVIKKAEKISTISKKMIRNAQKLTNTAQQLQDIHSGKVARNSFFIKALNNIINSKDLPPVAKDAIIKCATSKSEEYMSIYLALYQCDLKSIEECLHEIDILYNTEYKAYTKEE